MSFRNEVLAVLHDEQIPERLQSVEAYVEQDQKRNEGMRSIATNRITQWIMVIGILVNMIMAFMTYAEKVK